MEEPNSKLAPLNLDGDPTTDDWKIASDAPLTVQVQEDDHVHKLASGVPGPLAINREIMKTSSYADERYQSDAEAGYKYIWRPLPWPVVYGLLALGAFYLVIRYHEIFPAIAKTYNGWVLQLTFMVTGIFFVVLAGPMMKPKDWKRADDVRDMRDKDYIANKRWRQRD